MAKPNTSYEETRKKRMEENRKRMEALNLPQLAQAAFPKPSPMKRQKPRKVEKQIVVVRRSARVATQPTPVYREVEVKLPRSYGRVSKHRDFSNRVYADEHSRAEATEKAEAFESGLGSDYPTFVKPMLQSHVTGGFWMGLPLSFCRKYLPKRDATVTLVDEQGEEYPTAYNIQGVHHKGGKLLKSAKSYLTHRLGQLRFSEGLSKCNELHLSLDNDFCTSETTKCYQVICSFCNEAIIFGCP
ncbi:hypothetical protein ACLB2K_009790 [Fragaria x ananassa]